MELILKKNVKNLGFKDDIVKVKNGYGRNFLIPTGQAILATSSAKKVLSENLKHRAIKEAKIIEEAKKSAEIIKEYEIKIAAETSLGDKIFGSVSNADLSEFLSKKGLEIDKKLIKISSGGSAIKRLGKYEANIRLHREVIIDISFEVVAK